MVRPVTQLRIVAVVYALLGVLATAALIVLMKSVWPGWTGGSSWEGFGRGAARAVAVSTSFAVVFWLLALLSFRYLALSRAWRSLALVSSLVVLLWFILAGIAVTFIGRGGAPGWRPVASQIVLAWVVVSAVAGCSYLLWRNLRASNNRWSGP